MDAMNFPTLVAVAGSLFLSATSHGQSRVWTWEPAKPANTTVYSNLQSSYIDGDGDTGLAYLEVHEVDDTQTVKLRLVWIANSGRVRKDTLIASTETPAAVFGNTPAGTYRILYASNSKWVATDGSRIYTARYDEKAKTVSDTTTTLDEGVELQAAQQPPAFPGWFQKEEINDDGGYTDQLTAVSLWTMVKQ
jgi:hypothetical protein